MHSLPMMALVLLAQLEAPPVQPGDSALARRLRTAALDQRATLNLDSALVLIQGARRADPAYLPAQLEYMYLRYARYEAAALRRESLSLARSASPRDRCVGIAMASFTEGRSPADELLAIAGGAPICSTFFLAVVMTRGGDFPDSLRGDFPDSLKLDLVTRALRHDREEQSLWAAYALIFEKQGNLKEAERILEQGRQATGHAITSLPLAMHQADLRFARGDTAGALALRRSLRAAVERDGRSGLRAVFEEDACAPSRWGDPGKDQEVRERRAVERTRVRGDWASVERTLILCGHGLIDRGEYLEALRHLTLAIPIADSVRLPDLYLELYTMRSRANWRLGRLTDAERDSRRSLDRGAGAGGRFYVADAYHNLAHVYESLGRWQDASFTIDRFVALTRLMYGQLHFTSLLDAGEIRWKAGWHASAREAFEEMVRLADQLHANYSWAGEYYERVGDLQRARQYYIKARSEPAVTSAALSGLARVYDKLGQADSAESVARLHDAQEAQWPPLEVPLMPAILARRGRSAEALRIAREWAERQEQRGNVRGASLAFLQLARLALDTRSANAALVAATHAESLATTLQLANERIQAATLRGRALRQLGLHDSAVTTLRLAAQLAGRDSSADNLFETHLALGDAFAEQAQGDAALTAYDRAARAAEHATRSLVEDLDRARYRDRHLLPFDGAVQVLVRGAPGAVRDNQLVAWSARRKAAALVLTTRIAAGSAGATRPHLTLAHVQGRLGKRDVLLDYLVLDSVVAVVAITRERMSVVRLTVSKDSLAAMVERLRRPLVTVYGGRLDLARTPFDLGTAAQLHAVLVRPLAPMLVGMRRLLIVPDGPLHALPFEALVVMPPASRARASDYAGAGYLIDRYEVEYLPSASFLAQPEPRRDGLSGARLLVVSVGAPGAEQEAGALRAAWPAGRTTLLEGAAATERGVKTAMPRFGVIHFAVHAQASARDPLASHLRLAREQKGSIEDGYLHVDEIAAAKVGARLVVLSACETDAGPILNGEGVMGLARAFLASGAHAVVGTQWPVGPTMADLMKQFYERLATGEAASPALRAAKLALRSRRETAHPFYWAGAVLVTGSGGR